MAKIDSGIHLRNLLKGLEASFVIFVAIISYDMLKEYEIKNIDKLNIPVKYHKFVSKFLHFFTIFVAEIIIVYFLIWAFGTEF